MSDPGIDQDLLARLIQTSNLSRRDFVRRVAIAASIPAVASLAAACGGGTSSTATKGTGGGATTARTRGAAPTATSGPVNQNVTETAGTGRPAATTAPQGKKGGS